MNLLKYYLLRQLRKQAIANGTIVPGDFYRGSGRFSGITVIVNHGIPKDDRHFCGTVIKVDIYSDCPVGVVANWSVRSFTRCNPLEKIILTN